MARKQEKARLKGAPALLVASDASAPFGRIFFLGQLGGFVRNRCPDPAEALPSVELRLVDGEVLDVCHIIGLSPAWVALAVRDGDGPDTPMRTELVPYASIMRVTIRPLRPSSAHFGFDHGHAPTLLDRVSSSAAEDALRIAATPIAKPTPKGRRSTRGMDQG